MRLILTLILTKNYNEAGNTAQKTKFSIKDFFSTEILSGKLHFLCSEIFGKSIKNQTKLGTIKNSYIFTSEKNVK